MNRSHNAESYLSLISKIREARPDILISGDFIVGFPEETDKDFDDTISLIKNVDSDYAISVKPDGDVIADLKPGEGMFVCTYQCGWSRR